VKIRAAQFMQSHVDADASAAKVPLATRRQRFNAAEPEFPELLPQYATTVACD
jgi:hypothetical protein